MTADQIRAIVLAQVNAYSVTWANAKSGSRLTKDTPAQAAAITDAMIFHADHFVLKLPFLMGAICAESDFCCEAWAENLLGANPTGSFGGTDWGPAQVNGLNLPNMPGMVGLSVTAMKAKAMDPAWAIPVVAQWYADLQTWAQDPETQAKIDYTRSETIPQAKNPYWLAALGYNRGRTGALLEANGTKPLVAHPAHVSSLCNHFCVLLGVPNLMPDANGLNLPGQGVSGYAPLT